MSGFYVMWLNPSMLVMTWFVSDGLILGADVTDDRDDGDSVAGAAEHIQPAQAGTEAEHRPSVRWRPPLFLAFLLGGVAAGILFKVLSTPGAVNAAIQGGAPQVIDVYADKTDVTVHLTAAVEWSATSGAPIVENLQAEAAVPGTAGNAMLLITSTIPPSPGGQGFEETTAYDGGKSGKQTPEWVKTVPVRDLSRNRGPYGPIIGTFRLPGIVQQTNDSLYAHLSALAPDESALPLIPALMTEQDKSSGPPRDLVDYPELSNPGLAGSISAASVSSNYVGVLGSPVRDLYYVPQALLTTEVIGGERLRPFLENAQIDSNLPSDGTLQGDIYVWQEAGSLEAFLSATDRGAIASESYDLFYSGIAFATAAAALVALAQELRKVILMPSWLPALYKRRRRSGTDGAASVQGPVSLPGANNP